MSVRNLFAVPEDETLADRCSRLALEVLAVEMDPTGRTASINLSEIRVTLEQAAKELGA